MEEYLYNREKKLRNAEKEFDMTNEEKNEATENNFSFIPSFFFVWSN
jgi:hypothetical protein